MIFVYLLLPLPPTLPKKATCHITGVGLKRFLSIFCHKKKTSPPSCASWGGLGIHIPDGWGPFWWLMLHVFCFFPLNCSFEADRIVLSSIMGVYLGMPVKQQKGLNGTVVLIQNERVFSTNQLSNQVRCNELALAYYMIVCIWLCDYPSIKTNPTRKKKVNKVLLPDNGGFSLPLIISPVVSGGDSFDGGSEERHETILGGGFKPVLFSLLFGEMIQFEEYFFQMGWFNHQLVQSYCLTIFSVLSQV